MFTIWRSAPERIGSCCTARPRERDPLSRTTTPRDIKAQSRPRAESDPENKADPLRARGKEFPRVQATKVAAPFAHTRRPESTRGQWSARLSCFAYRLREYIIRLEAMRSSARRYP